MKRHDLTTSVPLVVVLVFLGIFSTNALVSPVTIDPGAYTGRYTIDGQFAIGLTTVDLAAGTHTFGNFSVNTPASTFLFEVDGSGQVTSLNPAAAQGVGNTLQLNNASIVIDPGNYTFQYFFVNSSPAVFTGVQTVVLVPGLTYRLGNFSQNTPASTFLFEVDGNDQVTSLNPAVAQGVGSTLQLNNANIVIDPGNYTGQYFFVNSSPAFFTGLQTVVLVPGLTYRLGNASQDPTPPQPSTFFFEVDGSGQVTSLNPAAAQGVGNTLQFACVLVQVDPTTFTGLYQFANSFPGSFTGQVDITLVSSLAVRIVAGGQGGFFIPDINQVTPSTLTFTIAGQEHTFLFSSLGSCVIDDDNDGVDDTNDLCPGTTTGALVDADGCSDAQVDGDSDGVCDPGAPSGGPSGCTGTDNCPADPNTLQENNDGDALGDACDDDDDNDGVDDGADNCQFDANPGQEDLDGDGLGDACDPLFNGDSAIEQIRDDLQALLDGATCGAMDDMHLTEAIDKLTKAIDPDNLTEDGNPDPKKGKKVFKESKNAAKELQEIVNDAGPCAAGAQAATDTLVEVMQVLAQAAIDEAQAACNAETDPMEKATCQQEVDKANDEMVKAQDELDNGNPDEAIDKYKKAWKKAQKAIEAVGAVPGPGKAGEAGAVVAEVPAGYVLESNYPNPFNPQTTIRFSMPESAVVKLVVYDVLGRQVRVLVDSTREAGTHEVVFEASGLPSGTYLVRLVTPAGSFVQTMQLMK